MSNEVTIIGLGEMGFALARQLLASGYRVTGWNRTAAKGESLVEKGLRLAPTVADAVAASDVVIVCVADYATSDALLRAEGVDLKGRFLIQLSTGTPRDARDGLAWAEGNGVEYLDGTIMGTPRQIGRPETPIFASGPETAWKRAEPMLKALGGGSQFMGKAVGAAAAWDLAVLNHMWGAALGFFHSALMLEAEGISVKAFGETIQAMSPILGEIFAYEADVIERRDFANPESTLTTSAHSVEEILNHARQAGISEEFPAFAAGIFRRGLAAGYGPQEVAALVKVMGG